MKLLLVNYEFPPLGGGGGTATYEIGRCMAQSGHTVAVLTAGYKGLSGLRHEKGMYVYRCPALRRRVWQSNMMEMASFVVSAACWMPRILTKHHIEICLVFFSLPCGPLGLWGKLLCSAPYVISLRGGDVPGTEASLETIHKILKPLRRRVFSGSKAIVANSDGLKRYAEAADPVHMHVISNGVDVDLFRPSKKRSMQDSTIRFLFIGRFSQQKNLFFLLDQMNTVAQQTAKPFEIHLVGDGPLEENLREYASGLNISRRVRWHGWVPKERILEHYHAADCLVNPSLYEGMPNVVLEAMACGLPVIASDVAGNSTVISHERTGLLFDLEHPEAFRKAVDTILENREVAVAMGKAGRQKVEECFAWEGIAEQYIALMEAI